MKKIILTELLLAIFVAVIATGLYYFIYGINLPCSNYLELLTFESRRLVIILEITGMFFLPLYLTQAFLRQIFHKFSKSYLTSEIFIGSALLAGLLFYKYLFLSSESMTMVKEGWTIYPPLTGIRALDEHDPLIIKSEQNLLLGFIGGIILLNGALVVATFRRRKKS